MGQQNIPYSADHYGQIDDGFESLVKIQPDGSNRLSLLVKGAHCAACIYKIENALRSERNVTDARLNFSTGHLSTEWTGSVSLANDFVQKIKNLGYDVGHYDISSVQSEHDKENRFLLMCLGVAGFAAGNIMLLSIGLWTTSAETMGIATRDFMHWISALIAIPTILYSGQSFFRSAISALKVRQTNMDVPISVGLILTGSMSLFETITHGEHAYFDSAVMLIFFLLIGRYFDFRARKKAKDSAADLLQSLSGFAVILENGKARHIPIRELREGHMIRISAGENFPVDGRIIEGISDADISLVTGETIPVSIENGTYVYAGSVNLTAPVILEASKPAENSLIADIARLMDKASQSHARYVRVADRAARLYTPVVHLLALLTYLTWWRLIGADWQNSLMIAITVLIITCPCALGLAVPVVQILATGKLLRDGILVKSGDALERLASIDRLLIDKTGTLTIGKPRLTSYYAEKDLKYAASLAVHSGHPLSVAIQQAYDGDLLPVTNIREFPGRGLQGIIGDKMVRLGNNEWCGAQNNKDITQGMKLWLAIEGEEAVVFSLSDIVRVDSAEVIRQFQNDGINPVLLSGDQESVVKDVTQKCSIDTYYAGQTPQEKFAFMEDLQQGGHTVLMVGDGLNDAPTLAGADISMAPGTAISLSQNAADIVFMGDRLSPVYRAYMTAKKAKKLVQQNFGLAVIYNFIAIPVAAMGFLTPFMAAIAMSGSSLIVIMNSFRVRS